MLDDIVAHIFSGYLALQHSKPSISQTVFCWCWLCLDVDGLLGFGVGEGLGTAYQAFPRLASGIRFDLLRWLGFWLDIGHHFFNLEGDIHTTVSNTPSHKTKTTCEI